MGRYLVNTFGCQMTAHDSDRMEEVLRAHGWTSAESVDEADLVVLNTCSVREKAEQKLRSEVGKLALLKVRKNRGLVLAVAGCVAQLEGEKLLARVAVEDGNRRRGAPEVQLGDGEPMQRRIRDRCATPHEQLPDLGELEPCCKLLPNEVAVRLAN